MPSLRFRRRCWSLLVAWFVCAPIAGTYAGSGFPSNNVTFLSHLDLDDFPGGPTSGNDCWGYVSPTGREYALMGLRNEVAVVEISSPSDPVIVAEIPHTSSNWCDIKVYQDFAYAVNEEAGGMDVIDLSQVDSGIVTLVQRVTTGGLQTSHNLAIDTDSGFLYLCDSNLNGGRLVAFDLTNPADPILAGQIDVVEGVDIHDAQVVTYISGPNAGKQIAFGAAGGSGLEIYDVTDKANMFRLSTGTYPNLSFAHQCWTEDLHYLYLNDELDAVNETVIFDITDLSNPIFAGTYTAGLPAIDHNLYVHQGFIYESEYTAGLRIFDAADPLNPVQVGWFDTYPDSDAAATTGSWSNYPFFPSGIILISTKNAGLFIVRRGPPPIVFDYPSGVPTQIDPVGDSFLVNIMGQDGRTLDPSSPLLHYDAGLGLVEVPMSPLGGSLYEAVFGPTECSGLVQFYISGTTNSGITIKDPSSAPTPTFGAVSGSTVNFTFEDDMETNLGWTTSILGDNATEGIWTRVDPNGNLSAPEADHTAEPGTLCYVTGQEPPSSNAGDNDVDGGKTTLLSPLFDLAGASDVSISYWRWYSNDFFQIDGDEGNGPNEEIFTIDITNDNGMNWINVETIGPFGPATSGDWIPHAFNAADYVTPTSQVRMRFVASDYGTFSVVEAGVDDFRLAIVICDIEDCNLNGIDDAIDIATCAPNDAACQDCNGNGSPDECDIPFPQQGSISLDSDLYLCEATATIVVSDCGLNQDGRVAENVMVLAQSDSEPAGESVLLTETGPDSGTFQGSISLSLTDNPGVLLVSEGDALGAEYVDADDGLGGMNVVVSDEAVVDCGPPIVSDIEAVALGPFDAAVMFTTNEPAIATVRYGLSCIALNDQASEVQFLTSFTIPLTGLTGDTTYRFAIDVEDQLGRSATYHNFGFCYVFQTNETPNYFTEHFESNDGDLDFRTILFAPDGSPDVYAPCIYEILDLPTDPTGGTVLSMAAQEFVAVTLPGGESVQLYNNSYSTFYVGGNGYITFESGDEEFSRTLAHHFNQPRISALFELFDIDENETISWKILGDRVAVTWENMSELFQGNINTFQVEMFFDGQIRLNYLNLDANDGLVGLSDGTGVLPGFLETDLSALGGCGPQPPTTIDSQLVTGVDVPLSVALVALDDGLPDPPGALAYVITMLPDNGALSDPGTGAISSVPHTLSGSSGLVDYIPGNGISGFDTFQFEVNDGGNPPSGGDSNGSTVSITVGSSELIYSVNLDIDPGWTAQGQWAYGQPTGGGSHNGDPTSAFTGANVFGYNLNGDYPDNLMPTHLTTTSFNCSELIETELRFQRWLGVEQSFFDHATVSASTDGLNWVIVWDHEGGDLSDASWTEQAIDISDVADGQPTVFFRWTMGPTDGLVTFPGWNIDDVQIWGIAVTAPCEPNLDGTCFGGNDGAPCDTCGVGGECGGGICAEPGVTAIPTVDAWGATIMALLILSAGTLVYRRCNPFPVR